MFFAIYSKSSSNYSLHPTLNLYTVQVLLIDYFRFLWKGRERISVTTYAAVILDIQSEKSCTGNISQADKEIPGRRRKGCGIKIDKRNGSRKQRLCKELQHYQKAGVRLLLNGRPSSPEEIARVCTIREDRCYMRDYISNDSDELWGIGFDFVRDMK